MSDDIVKQARDHAALPDRLRDAADRFLKWTYNQQYSGPPVISIPRHPDNVDAILCEAADEVVRLRRGISEIYGTVPDEIQHPTHHVGWMLDKLAALAGEQGGDHE